ncbi:MAG TPA: group 1 truncated hemoglobin [Trebonia sp.]|jgi:hemoglobin|nr:group 1 truncated hemoglobin [Trebonia sp.]
MDSTADVQIFDVIGGEPALTAVVDDFYVRVMADPQLAPFFAGVNMNKLKGRQVEFFAAALGGPDVYEGGSMRDVHVGRGISQADFDKVAHHLSGALADAGVDDETVTRIIGAIAPLSDDIVARGLA